MLLTAEVPSEMAKEIDRLVRDGSYPSHSALLRAALNNLLVQEGHLGRPAPEARVVHLTEAGPGPPSVSEDPRAVVISPELVEPAHSPVGMPLDYLATRLLPVKAVLTHLIDYLRARGLSRANLAKFSIQSVEESVKLKARLAEFDEGREVKPSTGFPDPTPKGMQRFIQVYIGGRRGNDTVFGVIASLGFVGFVTSSRGELELALTERGHALAASGSELEAFLHGETGLLPDPLFEPMELEILSQAVLAHEGEGDLIRFIFHLLRDSTVGRKELNDAVRGYFEQAYPGESRSSNVVSTHAAATVLRLRELGLLEGTWAGGMVLYGLTTRGRRWGREVGMW